MKKILFCLFVIAGLAVQAQQIDSTWIRNNYSKKEVYITMRDGVRLFTSIYIPKNKIERHPFLMTRTPYSCQPYGEENFAGNWNSYKKEYFKEGYIIVTQDVRGRWMSEGEFVDVRPFNANKKGKGYNSAVVIF